MSFDWCLVCVSWEIFLTVLYFRMSYCPPLQSLNSTHASALNSQVHPKGTWKREALAWVGYSLWRWGTNLTCEVYYSRFHEFFQYGENTWWIMDDFALGKICARCVDRDIVLPLAALKMEAPCSPKHQPTASFYSPKDGNLHSHPCYFLFVSLEFVYSKSIALQ
jgi:hypothetical protein